MASFGVTGNVRDNTRVPTTTSIRIDNIFTSLPKKRYAVEVDEPHLSDLKGLFMKLNITLPEKRFIA